MDEVNRQLDRRDFLNLPGGVGATAATAASLAACAPRGASPSPSAAAPAASVPAAAGSQAAAASAAATPGPTGTFNWLTWGDHWYQAEMDKIAADTGIKAAITSFSDNIDAY